MISVMMVTMVIPRMDVKVGQGIICGDLGIWIVLILLPIGPTI